MSKDEVEAMEPEQTLVVKWGCDGSSGHSVYSQPFSSPEISDAALFLTSLVPLRLHGKENKISWQKPNPSSNRFCRPLRFEFVKETKEVTLAEVNQVREGIAKLSRTEIAVRNKTFFFKFELIFSMIDGKVL